MPKPKETISRSEQETMQLASRLASRAKPGDLYLLRGNLGAGKSVFARAFIRDLMKDKDLEVPSPTYTLAQTYESGHGTIWHFDLYRLKEPEEIFEIGWEEALSGTFFISASTSDSQITETAWNRLSAAGSPAFSMNRLSC